MAQFYARIQGNRGEATRMGTKGSGIKATAETWTHIVETYLGEDEGVERAAVRIRSKDGQLLRVLYDGPLSAVTQPDTRGILVGEYDLPASKLTDHVERIARQYQIDAETLASHVVDTVRDRKFLSVADAVRAGE